MRTRIPIEDSFDLHSFLPGDVDSALTEYLREAQLEGASREVRVIHGKGKGVRRAQVRQLLEANPVVASFFDAPPERGSFGATVVLLKPQTPHPSNSQLILNFPSFTLNPSSRSALIGVGRAGNANRLAADTRDHETSVARDLFASRREGAGRR